MDSIAQEYVKLTLEIGLYDPYYVDAYYGPEDWKLAPESKEETFPAKRLLEKVNVIHGDLKKIDVPSLSEDEVYRYQLLEKQIIATRAGIEILSGKKFSFDEESTLLYDTISPKISDEEFQKAIDELDHILKGEGTLSDRIEKHRKEFTIPKDKLDAVFQRATQEGRERTLQYVTLPENESFTLEYVTDQVWSGYNWYKGNAYSLIQVNTDFPIQISRAVDLACHEGYPGHHVFNMLLEKHLAKEKEWVEYTIYPLYCPTSLLAEGTANYGIEVAFTKKERLEFEKNVLFPLAGLDPQKVDEYYYVQGIFAKLSYTSNEAARGYQDGKRTKEETIQWLIQYALSTPQMAEQRFGFIEQMRSYVINYNLGQDLVKEYIESKGGTEDNFQKRWDLFTDLLANPRTASFLK